MYSSASTHSTESTQQHVATLADGLFKLTPGTSKARILGTHRFTIQVPNYIKPTFQNMQDYTELVAKYYGNTAEFYGFESIRPHNT